MKTKKMSWFCERTVPGKRYGKMKHCFLIEKLIFKGKSPYQKILIFDNSVYGKVFVLDDIVQLSESDEFIYHEMLTHPFLMLHPNPKKFLIIGGGDGGTLRECLKYNPDEIFMVDIDKKVIELAKQYLTFVNQGAFNDKRLRLFHEDGKNFMKRHKDYFDMVIIDGGDPIGPSVSLFAYKFYQDIFAALKEDGIASFQIGSFLDTPLIKSSFTNLKKVFPHVSMVRLDMPSYHCGDYCFMGASKKYDFDKFNPKDLEERFGQMKKESVFKYYSPEIHQASRVIPEIFKVK
ncbi:MAG: polyamine aminopropyltransferase [Candidatus Omnitrophica bacterium]|nr:polyamine aminopropyltransferase [Candidatus Omnitrophota bacterium]